MGLVGLELPLAVTIRVSRVSGRGRGGMGEGGGRVAPPPS